jgi:hypothetical protein
MPDTKLPPIRIGFGYTVEIDYPAGFLAAGEGVRTKLRRWVDDTAFVPTDTRNVDTVLWELTEEQTADMPVGEYYAEAEIYDTANPAATGVLLTDNRYVFLCDHSPSE